MFSCATVKFLMARIGSFVYVLDKGRSYKSKVIHERDGKIKVHYVNFNSRFDEWLPCDSDRIVDEGKHNETNCLDVVPEAEKAIEDAFVACDDGDRGEKRGREPSGSPEAATNLAKRPSIDVGETGITGAGRTASGRDIVAADGRSMAEVTGCMEGLAALTASLGSPVSNQASILKSSAPGGTTVISGRVCKFCSVSVSSGGVHCGGCNGLFHEDTLCLGIKQETISSLLGGDGGALQYLCCHCRGRGRVVDSDMAGGSPNGRLGGMAVGGMDQLLGIVGCLVGELRNLMSEVRSAGKVCSAPPPGPSSLGPQNEGDALAHLREIYERDKRKQSIVLRGFKSRSVGEVGREFDEVCDHLGLRVSLTSVHQIKEGLFRADVLDREKRLKLLFEAKRLRNSERFRRTFVQRDLTYAQRADLRRRRGAARTESSNLTPPPGTDRGVCSVAGGDSAGSVASATGARSRVGNWRSGGARGGGNFVPTGAPRISHSSKN